CQRYAVQVQLGEDFRDLLAVDDEVLPRVSLLTLVRRFAELVRPADHPQIEAIGIHVELREKTGWQNQPSLFTSRFQLVGRDCRGHKTRRYRTGRGWSGV